MFTRKLNYRQKDMMMKAERILPVDLYNSVSTPELKLESSLRILYVKRG